MIPVSAIVALKDLRFELKCRAHCGALPVLDTLQALYAVKLNFMHVQRTKSVVDISNFYALSKLPEITVLKLMAENYEIFTAAFCYAVKRTIGINGIPIDYVRCGVNGYFDSPWMTREDNLKNCPLHTSD